jgi:S-DNA-T family DNA segregation ATPase FtsK/SpoIIIE
MSRVKVTRSRPSVLVPRIRGLRESALWVFIGLSTILFLALASYHPADPAFSVSSDTQVIQNRMGPVGAWFADLAYLLFGRPAYLLPSLVLLAGIMLFRGREGKAPLVKPALLLRIGGVLLLLATSCGLARLHFFAPEMRETAGGIIGQLVGGALAQVLGLLGATVLLVVLWLASVSLATSISWLAIMDITGRGVFSILLKLEICINQTQIWLEGLRDKQHRQDLVSKSRAKPKAEATRIEPSFNVFPSSERLERERQVPLFEPTVSNKLPPLALLDDTPSSVGGYSADALEAISRLVELKLADFGIEVEVVSVQPGPVVRPKSQ